jgi:hypothetical protein
MVLLAAAVVPLFDCAWTAGPNAVTATSSALDAKRRTLCCKLPSPVTDPAID